MFRPRSQPLLRTYRYRPLPGLGEHSAVIIILPETIPANFKSWPLSAAWLPLNCLFGSCRPPCLYLRKDVAVMGEDQLLERV